MNKIEYLLTCLSEECDEVGQRASKALRFGLTEVQKDQSLDNSDRIAAELKDLISLGYWLEDLGVLPRFLPSEEEVAAKKRRVRSYSAISVEQGTLDQEIDI